MNLTMARRQNLPSSSFGLPKTHGFPMNDPTHARLAIGGATRAFDAGNIGAGTEDRIKAMARRKLGMNPRDAMVAKLRGGSDL